MFLQSSESFACTHRTKLNWTALPTKASLQNATPSQGYDSKGQGDLWREHS